MEAMDLCIRAPARLYYESVRGLTLYLGAIKSPI